MRNTLFCLLMVGYISTFAQNGTTFKVENLSKPEKLLFIKFVCLIPRRLPVPDRSPGSGVRTDRDRPGGAGMPAAGSGFRTACGALSKFIF